MTEYKFSQNHSSPQGPLSVPASPTSFVALPESCSQSWITHRNANLPQDANQVRQPMWDTGVSGPGYLQAAHFRAKYLTFYPVLDHAVFSTCRWGAGEEQGERKEPSGQKQSSTQVLVSSYNCNPRSSSSPYKSQGKLVMSLKSILSPSFQ